MSNGVRCPRCWDEPGIKCPACRVSVTLADEEGQLIAFSERASAALWPVMLEMLAHAWDQGARAATADYGIGAAANPYREPLIAREDPA